MSMKITVTLPNGRRRVLKSPEEFRGSDKNRKAMFVKAISAYLEPFTA